MAGRRKRSLVRSMQAMVWIAELKAITDLNTTYALAKKIGGSSEKSFHKYASGTSAPSVTNLKLVDKKFKMSTSQYPCASEVFRIGPLDGNNGYAPLWDALGDDMEKVWSVLSRFNINYELFRAIGFPHSYKMEQVTRYLLPTNEIPEKPWLEERSKPNVIAEAYNNKRFKLEIELLTAIVALWQFSMFVGDHKLYMDYIMIGLMEDAIPDLLKKYGITNEFNNRLIEIDEKYMAQYKSLMAKQSDDNQQAKMIDKTISGVRVCEVLKPDAFKEPGR